MTDGIKSEYNVFNAFPFCGNVNIDANACERLFRGVLSDMRAFLSRYGENVVKDRVLHTCLMCNKTLAYTHVNLSRHVLLHDLKADILLS